MKKIGLLSDLHLENSNIEIIDPGWDYLVIAGDLSSDIYKMQNFFDRYAPKNIPIIYVLGNHEYEGRRYEDVNAIFKEALSPFENVHLLDNSSIVIDGIKFIGSTLWTNFELEGIEKKKEEMDWARNNIGSLTYIYKKKDNGKFTSITPEEIVELNKEAYKFLEFELKNNPFDGEKVVVTHFAPHKNSVHKSHKDMMSSFWVNHFEELMGFSKYWFHGHVHKKVIYDCEGTQVACNARGVSKTFNLSSNPEFDKELYFPINSLENNLENSKKNRI